jgi:hypothetical protein
MRKRSKVRCENLHDFGPTVCHFRTVKAPTREQELQWVAQYKAAAIGLEEQRIHELQTLTEEEALRQSDALLSLARRFPRRRRTSGLVRQQALFHRRWPK